LGLNFDHSSPKAVIWQWNQISIQTREIILELARFNTKLSKQDVLEPWAKCTLNLVMELVSKGWVDLRFDAKNGD